MKIKNVKLEWYAFKYDCNSQKLVFINVLNGWEEKIYKKVKKGTKELWQPVIDYASFKEWLKREFMFYYWGKFEHECLIGDLTNKVETLEKHDIYWQLEPNLDRICEYIIREMKIEF